MYNDIVNKIVNYKYKSNQGDFAEQPLFAT